MKHEMFESISLDEINQKVRMMKRVDTKYWFHVDDLWEVLQDIRDEYLILEIDGARNFTYITTYFDTAKNKMYTDHHNGKLNRYKIRHRYYVESDYSFLEIKFKNNKGRTLKSRIKSSSNKPVFSESEGQFILANTPYSCDDLVPALRNEFNRMTIVNKDFTERCTVDLNLKFSFGQENKNLEGMAIFEIKTDGKPKPSPLMTALKKRGLKASGFSKYCVGRAIMDTGVKRNSLKHKLRQLHKLVG